MKTLSLFYVFLFLLFFIECTYQSRDVESNTINLNQISTVSIFDVFQEVDAIQLETSERSLIGYIYRLIEFLDKFLILDYGNQKVLCFSNEGSFLFQVGNPGNGIGEYKWVTDIAFNPQDSTILLLDATGNKILVFCKDGVFNNTFSVKTTQRGLNRLIPISGNRFLLYVMGLNEWLVYSTFDERTTNSFGGSLGQQGFFLSLDNVYSFDGNGFFFPPFESTIWKLCDEGWSIHKKFDFGPHNNDTNSTRKVFDLIPEWERENRRIMPNFFTGKGRLLNHHLIQAFETQRFLVLNIEFQNEPKNVLIDKINGKQKVFNSFSENLCFPLYAHKQSNSLIMTRRIEPSKPNERFLKMYPKDAEDIVSFYNRNHTFYTRDILTERGKEVYDNHDPMHDNPYLVIFRFKE